MGKNILWFFIVTFLSISSGCVSCQYYDSYQPQAIDWNMHGKETKWKEPEKKGEKPSSAWAGGGMLLVMLSPVFGFLAFVTSVLVEKQMQKSDKRKAQFFNC